MKERQITIHNKAGIHCRPSSMILNSIHQNYPLHTFLVVKDNEVTELNSILSLISLGLICGDSAVLQVSGPEEDKALQEIGDLFEYEFDFPTK